MKNRILSLLSTFIFIFTSFTIPTFAVTNKEIEEAIEYSGKREKLNFNQGWKFIRGNIKEAVDVNYPIEDLERWESVNLPHTVRVEPYINSGGINYQGPAMYRKHFSLPKSYDGKKLYIEFEGVMGVTDVWINGKHLQGQMAEKTGNNTNYGGYLPFKLDVSDFVNCDGEYNVITVLTDNSDNINVPPGKPQSQLDFTYFGGIYRNVWLEVTNQVYITDPIVEDIVAGGGILVDYPEVSKESATVSVNTHIRNEKNVNKEVELKTEIVDANGIVIETTVDKHMVDGDNDYTFKQSIKVKKPNLWNLDNPYMYKLISTVFIDGKEVDNKETPIGIRKITMSKETGLLINGESAGFLSGVNRHQEYPYIGYGASANLQRRDAIKFKSAGFNIVRTAHSVQSLDFINACDELGILVMECVPGWQHWSSDEVFGERVKNDIRQMIRRTRNNPSILSYEISLNESPGVPRSFTNDCEAVAKEEHPSLKTSAENPHKGAIADILYGTPEEVASWSDTAMSLIREYADYWGEQNGDFTDLARVTRGPGTYYPGGEAAMLKSANNNLWNGYTFVGTGGISLAEGIENYNTSNHRFIGVTKWIGIDHNRGYSDKMSPCGLWDLRRIPKYSYYAFESQRSVEKNSYLESKDVSTGPSMFIGSSWGEEAPIVDKLNEKIGTDNNRLIYVYSNSEKVKLSVMGSNGEVLWSQTNNPITDKTAGNLDHPPFCFTEVPYTNGSYIKAEGLDSESNIIITKEMHTSGEPAQLKIEVDQSGANIVADGSDAVMAYAYVLDKDGNLCQDATNKLYFSTTGEGSIIGDGDKRVGSNPIDAEAGIIGALIKSTETAGEIKIKVESEGLTPAEITINSEIFTEKSVPFEEIAQGPLFEYRSMYLVEKEEVIQGEDKPSITKGTVRINNEDYVSSIEAKNMARLEYDLGGNYSRFTSKVALKDSHNSKDGTIFKVYLDGVLSYVSEPVKDQIADIDLDVTGTNTLAIVAEDKNGINTSKILWLSPYIYEGSTPEDESELHENLAKNKTAIASSTDIGTTPEGAVDGSMDTLWRSSENVTIGNTQTWSLDLGSQVNLRNAKLAVENDYLQCTYNIYTSKDGQVWDLKSTNTKTAHGNENIDKFVADNVQYIKVEFTDVQSTQGSGDGRAPKASIKEFEVYLDKGVETVKDYNLKGFEIAGKNITFNSKQTDYTIKLQGFEKIFKVKAMAENNKSTVKINNIILPNNLESNINEVAYEDVELNSDNQIIIEVTSPDGIAKKVYTITAEGESSYDNFNTNDCFVPGINGANNWYYQKLDKATNIITDMEDYSAGYVQGEYAWKGQSDWIYSGPRYMHSLADTNAVRTFKAPKDGILAYECDIQKFLGQSGDVSFKVLKNGTKIWPENSNESVLSQGNTMNISLIIDVEKDDEIQFVMDSYGSIGGDATCAITTARYLDNIEIASVTIKGEDTIVANAESSINSVYTAVAMSADGNIIPGFKCDWSLKTDVKGVSISKDGILTVDKSVKKADIVIQASVDGEILATKNVSIDIGVVDYLSDLEWVSATAGYGTVQRDFESDGVSPIRLTGEDGRPVTYKKGIGTHATSKIVYNIKNKGYTSFESMIGVDYSQNPEGYLASLTFKVFLNGDESNAVYDSGVMIYNTPQKKVSIPLDDSIETITLYVEKGDVDYSDHANWADAKFIKANEKSSNADISRIYINEKLLEGFDSSILNYTVQLEQGVTEAPKVRAIAADNNAKVEVAQATSLSGTATIKVTAEDGTEKTYTIKFEEIKVANADFNSNGIIDLGDLSIASKYYGKVNDKYDLNGDGVVGDYEINFITDKIFNK